MSFSCAFTSLGVCNDYPMYICLALFQYLMAKRVQHVFARCSGKHPKTANLGMSEVPGYTHFYIHIRIYIYIYMYIHTYIYIYTKKYCKVCQLLSLTGTLESLALLAPGRPETCMQVYSHGCRGAQQQGIRNWELGSRI